MLSAGSQFAGYRIERVLGSGGMGTVYLGRGPDLPRSEAIKVLSAELSRDPEFRARFVREAGVAAGLDHPNVVSIYGRGEFEDQLWIAMQFVDGIDADDALVAGTMTPARAVHVVNQVSKALDYAHAHQVVHRDVKPANFLLSGPVGPEERVLLSDFGIARALDSARLTATGSFMATVAYAAPEVLVGGDFDGRADLYSLGCTLFRLLTGTPPFDSTGGMASVMAAHLTSPPPRVTDRMPALSARMDAVVATAMAKDPARRFSSAREFATAAAEALGEATTVALRPVPGSAVAPRVHSTIGGTQQEQLPPPGPPGYPPSGPLVFHPSAKGGRGPWILLAVALVVVVALVGVCATLFARSKQGGAPAHAAAAPPSTSVTTSAPPTVSPAALDGLLLTAQQLVAMLGAPKMVVVQTVGQLVDDSDAEQLFGKDADCTGPFFPAQHRAYSTTGWKAARRQDLYDGNEPTKYSVYQAVVTFTNANAAQRALDTQRAQWQACSGRTITMALPGNPQQLKFGPLSNADGIVSMRNANEAISGWGCQRAMTVRENAIVDVGVCVGDELNQGIDVLNAIAARIK